jgi:hypothetical protein
MPEVASVPVSASATGRLYQPFASGARSSDPDALGGVASYLSVALTASFVLPARSVHEPVTVRPVPSGPAYRGPAQEAMPEVASLPVTPRATGRLYQPFASGSRSSAPVAEGGVASYFKASVTGALVLPARSVHVPEREAAASSGPA